MGESLDEVQVHSGADAERSAATIGARAFTVGQHIVFGRGGYDPVSSDGRRRLAHELTHVVQQRSMGRSVERRGDDADVDPDPAAELAAQRAGAAFAGSSKEALHGATTTDLTGPTPGTRPHGRPGRLIQREADFVGPPTLEQFSVGILHAATRILGPGNVDGIVFHHGNAYRGSAAALPQPVRWMLFEFWLARSAREPREPSSDSASSYRRATTAERLARLEDGRERAEAVLSELGPRPLAGAAGEAARRFQEAYDDAYQRVFDETVEAELEAMPLETVFEAPDVELEQQRRAVGDTIAAIDHFLALRVGSSAAVRLTPEITAMLNSVGARFPGTGLADASESTVRGRLFRVRGVLNGLNTILVLTDERRRTELLEAEFSVRSTAARSRFVLGMVEGGTQMTSIIGGFIARQRGNTELATRLFQLGTGKVVRNIGWLAALAQTVHGLSVLVDPASTESQRLQGVFDVAMGTAGLTGAAATLGVEALAGLSGPLTAGIVITAAEIAYLRSQIRGMETGMATAGIRQSLNLIEYEAGGVARRANILQRALDYSAALIGPVRTEVTAAAQHQIDFSARRLREFLERAIERVTTRQGSIAILFQPASWTHLRQPFLDLQPQLDAARSPAELLAVATAYLATARDLFRHIERTIVRTLIDVDRTREGGLLPHPLGGLHDSLAERAAAEQD